MSLEYVIYLLIYTLSLYDVITSSYGHMASLVWKNGEWWNGRIVALSQNSWKGLKITRKIAFQTDGVPIKIWNEHLQNKVYTHTPSCSGPRYRQIQLLICKYTYGTEHNVGSSGSPNVSVIAKRRSNDDLYRI